LKRKKRSAPRPRSDISEYDLLKLGPDLTTALKSLETEQSGAY
jgi:hypothetical protein